MGEIYARVSGGKITPVRWNAKQLSFGDTLANVIATGDVVIPLLSPAPDTSGGGIPLYRDPSQLEIESVITDKSMIAAILHDYLVGEEIAALEGDQRLSMKSVPGSVKSYKGTWNPIYNSPYIRDGYGTVGDMYQVMDGFPNDITVNLGSRYLKVRSGVMLEYREDNRWYSAGFPTLSKYERGLLDTTMFNREYFTDENGGAACNQHGAYGIETYPQKLEGLRGGWVVGQLVPVNVVRGEIHLVWDGNLRNLQFDTITGTIVVDASSEFPGVYRPRFMVGGSLGRSDPIEVEIEILNYTLQYSGFPINLDYGATHFESIMSPQNPSPTLCVVDTGGMWDVIVSSDGSSIEMDTFCVDTGNYVVKVQAEDDRGRSEILDIPVSVTVPIGIIPPTWEKSNFSQSGPAPISDEERAFPRADFIGLDSIGLDCEL